LPGYTIEALARKPLRWITAIYEILQKQEARQELRQAKYNALAQRIEKNDKLMQLDDIDNDTESNADRVIHPVHIANLPGASVRRNGKRI